MPFDTVLILYTSLKRVSFKIEKNYSITHFRKIWMCAHVRVVIANCSVSMFYKCITRDSLNSKCGKEIEYWNTWIPSFHPYSTVKYKGWIRPLANLMIHCHHVKRAISKNWWREIKINQRMRQLKRTVHDLESVLFWRTRLVNFVSMLSSN